jgi:hypothetical protein
MKDERPFLTRFLWFALEVLAWASVGGLGGLGGASILSMAIDWASDVPFSFLAPFGTFLGATAGVHLGCLIALLGLYLRSRKVSPSRLRRA